MFSTVRASRIIALAAFTFVLCTLGCAQWKARRPSDKPGSLQDQLRKRLTEGAVLLSMYAHTHEGNYPDSLEDLKEVNPYYREITADPRTGKQFVYVGKGLRLTDDPRALLVAVDEKGDKGLAITVEGKFRRMRRRDWEAERG